MEPTLVVQYLLELATTYMIPSTIWIVSTWALSRRLRNFTPENYQAQVRETLETNLIEKMSDLLDSLYRGYGLTPPTRSAPFPRVIRHLLDENPNEDRFTLFTFMYNSLLENGQESGVFSQVVHANSFGWRMSRPA